jgi:MFS family permease
VVGLLVVIYAAFTSLGLPDSLLGSAWPVMFPELGVASGVAGIVSMITASFTTLSSLLSARLNRRFGTVSIVLVSVCLTALALAGFAVAPSFWVLCLLAVPLGAGAGSIDAALNNFVALHYAATHMNWLHACWGLGASIGPVIMGQYLAANLSWRGGYLTIAIIQGVLAVVVFATRHWWRRVPEPAVPEEDQKTEPLGLWHTAKLPKAKAAIGVFIAYCALEGSMMLWASTFLVHVRDFPTELAASFAAFYVLGITAGRILSGFAAIRFTPISLVWAGIALIIVGIALLLLPWTATAAASLLLMGIGSGPIYPNMIHETPRVFGAVHSPTMIGLQMAGANFGILVFPALFGALASLTGYAALPVYVVVILVAMALLILRVRSGMKQA